VYPRSIFEQDGAVFFMGNKNNKHVFGLLQASTLTRGFDVTFKEVKLGKEVFYLGLGETNHTNACALRKALPWTASIRVGVHKSAGLGDRIGNATPGHVRAMRHTKGIIPVFAQQSIREMERTVRTSKEVMDAASWGVFQEGWTAGFGSDADHLKTPADIDYCADAGFIMYTFDPRDHVDNDAETDDVETLKAKFAELPWDRLETTADATSAAYVDKSWSLEGFNFGLNEEQVLRAACKYGRALAHVKEQYRYLVEKMGDRPYEVEVSVDETDTPTRPEEHLYIVLELKRLGVQWVSLAPRFIGRFEKGVDYIGDLDEFEAAFAKHVAIAKAMGPYKISLHSGSDKFSVYPIAAKLAGDLVHLKTAGTSYLESLRAVSRVDPSLFREILAFAIDNYEEEKVSYHVSAVLDKMINPDTVADADLPSVLDQFDTRQALHVTFGKVLTIKDDEGNYIFKDRLMDVLSSNEETLYDALETYLAKHVVPFSD